MLLFWPAHVCISSSHPYCFCLYISMCMFEFMFMYVSVHVQCWSSSILFEFSLCLSLWFCCSVSVGPAYRRWMCAGVTRGCRTIPVWWANLLVEHIFHLRTHKHVQLLGSCDPQSCKLIGWQQLCEVEASWMWFVQEVCQSGMKYHESRICGSFYELWQWWRNEKSMLNLLICSASIMI